MRIEPKLALVLGILLLIPCAIIQFPYNASIVLLAIYFIGYKWNKLKNFLPLSFILSSLMVCVYFCVTIMPNYHKAPWLTPIISLSFKVLGYENKIINDMLCVVIDGNTFKFAISYEQSGFWVFLPLLISFLVYLIFISRKKAKSIVSFLGLSLLYFFVRYVILMLAYLYLNNISVFYSDLVSILSFIPYCALFCVFAFTEPIEFEFTGNHFKAAIVSLSFVVAMGLFQTSLFVNMGNVKGGKIFIDEYHSSGWESVYEPLDRENYGGQRSTYTYYSLVKMLQQKNEVIIIDTVEDYQQLSPLDVLIIKTPTKIIETEIADQIHEFVNNGGGLFVIGDHTNLFDMSKTLNSLMEPYGVTYDYNAVYDLQTANLTLFQKKFMQAPYSEISSLVDQYKFATSCSIKSRGLSSPIIIGNQLAAEQFDISHPNFFGDLSLSEEEYFGLFTQATAMRYGNGRVVVYSDSTTFSSYSVFMHNNPEFIFSIIDYLSKSNSPNYLLILSLIFVTAAGATGFLWRKHLNCRILSVGVVLLMPLAFALSISVSSVYTSLNTNEIQKSLNSIETVYFLRSEDEQPLSHFVGMSSDLSGQYSSMFIAFQRLGFFPRETNNVQDCLDANTKMIVITDPYSVKHDELHALDIFVNHGGNLIIGMSQYDARGIPSMLDFFKIKYRIYESKLNISIENNGTDELHKFSRREFMPSSSNFLESFFFNDTIYSYIDCFSFANAGNIFILTDIRLFDNVGMGDPGMPPSEEQIERHQLLFGYVDHIFESH